MYQYNTLQDIPQTLLKKYDLLLIDLDNTVVEPETTTWGKQAKEWLASLPTEFLIVSNSPTASERTRLLHLPFHKSTHKKPSKQLFKEINKTNVLVIGDRVFTDVWWAKRNKVDAVLVSPVTINEQWCIRLTRPLERFVARYFVKTIKYRLV